MGKFYFKYTNRENELLTVARDELSDLIARAKELMPRHQLGAVTVKQTIEQEGGTKVYPVICTIVAENNYEQFRVIEQGQQIFSSSWLKELNIQQVDQAVDKFMTLLTESGYIDDFDKEALWSICLQ